MFEWTRHGEDTFILIRKDKLFNDLARIDWTTKGWRVVVLCQICGFRKDPTIAKKVAQEFLRGKLLGANGCIEKRTAQHMKCTKTWEHDVGACATCETGCFRRERVDVHLRQHR